MLELQSLPLRPLRLPMLEDSISKQPCSTPCVIAVWPDHHVKMYSGGGEWAGVRAGCAGGSAGSARDTRGWWMRMSDAAGVM